jgi:putative acetyltransferase
MFPTLPKGYSHILADNQHVEIAKSIIFSVLEEYGLIPDNPDLDYDLEDIDFHFRDGYFGLVVNELDNFVGTFALYKIDDKIAEIRKMYLLPSSRKNGIGKWMLAFLTIKAKELGFRKVQLLTASPLIEAINLYEKSGFIEMKSPDSGPRCDKAFYKML